MTIFPFSLSLWLLPTLSSVFLSFFFSGSFLILFIYLFALSLSLSIPWKATHFYSLKLWMLLSDSFPIFNPRAFFSKFCHVEWKIPWKIPSLCTCVNSARYYSQIFHHLTIQEAPCILPHKGDLDPANHPAKNHANHHGKTIELRHTKEKISILFSIILRRNRYIHSRRLRFLYHIIISRKKCTANDGQLDTQFFLNCFMYLFYLFQHLREYPLLSKFSSKYIIIK